MRRLLLVCVWMTATMAMATNYYCSPSGYGDGSSHEKPGSFGSLLAKIGAGDTLFCLGGQYDFGSTVSIQKTGTADARVCIFNYPGETPIFDFRGQEYGSRGFVIKAESSYIHIKGLTIRYTGKNGLHNSGSNNIFELLDVYGNGDTGIQMKAGGNNLILNCDSHDNFDYMLANDFGGNADGFADKQYEGGGNIYRGCRAWNNSDDGWDFYQRENQPGTVTVLENCICYKNGPKEYDMRDHPRYEVDKSWFDQFQTPQQVEMRKGNVETVSLEHYFNNGNANGFKLGGGYTNCATRLVGCLAVGNGAKGFDQNNNDGKMEVYNGSAWNNGSDYNFSSSGVGSLTIINCLTPGGEHKFTCNEVTDQNNSWNIEGITCTTADFVSMDDELILTPRQEDGSLTETPFMRLVSGSDMIDAGIVLDIAYPYSGTRPDLGCYEYGEVVYPPTLTCTSNNATQTVRQGQEISAIVMEWSGSATGAEVTGLPEGLSVSYPIGGHTMVISGKLTEVGTYTFTAKTKQEEGVEGMSLIVTITVKEDKGVEVAYVTIPGSAADKPVLEALGAKYNVVEMSASVSNNDYTSYDLIVMSSVPKSSEVGMVELKGVDKPVLLLKPWMLKAGIWDWGTAVNTQDAAMNIVKPEHPIFTGIDVSSGELTFFSAVTSNAVTYISQWNNASEYIEIATPLTATGQSIFELPAGGTYNGTTLTRPLLCIGLSEYSLADITADGQQVIVNACEYLLGNMATGISAITTGGACSGKTEVYDLYGRRYDSMTGLPKGIYIINGKKKILL